jgi:hypothetical protein
MRATLGSRHVIEPHNVSASRLELTSGQRRRRTRAGADLPRSYSFY